MSEQQGTTNTRPGVSGGMAPLAAIVSSVATLGCCVPLSFAAALGAGAASAFWTAMRPWLLAISVLTLGYDRN